MATFSVAVAASSDDAQETGGTVTLTDLAMNVNGTAQYAGMRFLNVTIPQGSTINTATVSLNFISTSYDSPDTIIYCENVDDATTFTTGASNISGRSLTSGTAWAATNLGLGVKVSANFAAEVQTVVNRGGWASGNDLNVIIKGNSGTSEFRVSTWDSANPEPVLDIDYTAPSGGGPVKFRHYQNLISG